MLLEVFREWREGNAARADRGTHCMGNRVDALGDCVPPFISPPNIHFLHVLHPI